MPSIQALLRSAAGTLLLGSMSLVAPVARAQTSTPVATNAPDIQAAAARVAASVCSKNVVLLGELPEHGEARGFAVKAQIVERLAANCGFQTVLFEAGSYDFFGLERAIAAHVPNDSLELALARAIGGLWWTRELTGFRQWLVREAVAGRVTIGGIDDQPSATAVYARATLPKLVGAAAPPARAAECQEAVARHLTWGYTATLPYDSTEQARLAECTQLAAARSAAQNAARRTPDKIMLDNVAGYFARTRMDADRGDVAAPDRDLVMAGNVAWWSERRPNDAKIVVWTATVHAARTSAAQPALPRGVPPLGARLSERWGDRLAAIGFTALGGQWARAGRPSQPLAALPPDALEAKALAATAASDRAGWVYLDRAMLRSLGAVPSRLFGKVMVADWSTAFDGVVVFRDEVAPTFEPRR